MSLCQCIYWNAKNAGKAVGFPWNAKVTVESVLFADLLFHSASALLQYTFCNRLEISLISALLASTLPSLSLRRFSLLDDLICLGLRLLTVGTVSVCLSRSFQLIYNPEPHCTLSHLQPQAQMLHLLIFPLHSFHVRHPDLSLSSRKSSPFSGLIHPQLHLCGSTTNLPEYKR